MKIELCNCTNMILAEIANKACTRDMVARTIALSLRSSEDVDWKSINAAIITRWSQHAREYIFTRAWSGKCFENIKPNRHEGGEHD